MSCCLSCMIVVRQEKKEDTPHQESPRHGTTRLRHRASQHALRQLSSTHTLVDIACRGSRAGTGGARSVPRLCHESSDLEARQGGNSDAHSIREALPALPALRQPRNRLHAVSHAAKYFPYVRARLSFDEVGDGSALLLLVDLATMVTNEIDPPRAPTFPTCSPSATWTCFTL